MDLRAAELHRLGVGLEREGVLARLGGGRVGERLEDDLVEAAREAVGEDRGDLEVDERAPVAAVRGLVAELQELGGGARVGLVGARPARLGVRDVLADVLLLRAELEDALEQAELLVGLAAERVDVGERAQRGDVVGREIERAPVHARSPWGDRRARRRRGPRPRGARPLSGFVSTRRSIQRAARRRVAARERELDAVGHDRRVVEAELRVAAGELLGLGRAVELAERCGRRAEERDERGRRASVRSSEVSAVSRRPASE